MSNLNDSFDAAAMSIRIAELERENNALLDDIQHYIAKLVKFENENAALQADKEIAIDLLMEETKNKYTTGSVESRRAMIRAVIDAARKTS